MDDEPLTLRELMRLLQDMWADHPELADEPVVIEGCDCYDDVGAVEYFRHRSGSRFLALRRANGGALDYDSE